MEAWPARLLLRRMRRCDEAAWSLLCRTWLFPTRDGLIGEHPQGVLHPFFSLSKLGDPRIARLFFSVTLMIFPYTHPENDKSHHQIPRHEKIVDTITFGELFSGFLIITALPTAAPYIVNVHGRINLSHDMISHAFNRHPTMRVFLFRGIHIMVHVL